MSPPLRNDRFLRALRREPVDVTPIWIMRQAGRYLPEYRDTRQRAGDFLSLCKNPELACEVTLQPLERFDLDAAILFSDILTIPDAMGLGLRFAAGEGPYFERPVRTEAEIAALRVPEVESELGYVMEAVRVIREALAGRVPLIGFSGSPWTLATYMVEGGGSREFARIKAMMYQRPELVDRLVEVLAEAVTRYLAAQIRAGVQAAMIFDTWGGVLTPHAYRRFSLGPMTRVVERLAADPETAATPVILFTKGGGGWLEDIAASGCAAVGLDWTVDLGEARQRVGDRVALQGNMDPAVLYAPPRRIREEVGSLLARYGHGTGHVFNLGHGIHQAVDPEHVKVLVEAVHELSRPYHQGG